MPDRIELNRHYKAITIRKYYIPTIFENNSIFHPISEPELIAMSSQQRYTQALARRVVNRIPELRNLYWEWQNNQGVSGNALVSESLGTTEINTFGNITHGSWFYLIEFNSYQLEWDNVSILYVGNIDNQRSQREDRSSHSTFQEILSEMRNIENVVVRRNTLRGTIEVMIPTPPTQEVRRFLRVHFYRWNRNMGIWSRTYDDLSMNMAQGWFGLLNPEPTPQIQTRRQRRNNIPVIDANDDSVLFS